jgi:hypothetical protein
MRLVFGSENQNSIKRADIAEFKKNIWKPRRLKEGVAERHPLL